MDPLLCFKELGPVSYTHLSTVLCDSEKVLLTDQYGLVTEVLPTNRFILLEVESFHVISIPYQLPDRFT